MGAPSTEQVASLAAEIVRQIMSKGSDKSGAGEWYTRDSLRYHTDRITKHLGIAMTQIDGSSKSPDENGETAKDHLSRVVCRAV
ncbi:MAG: hypothetical protein EBS53_15755, partial [Bacteroidetes bacterium]|nr:hypothetical protein [Bacteroidota bacterium]